MSLRQGSYVAARACGDRVIATFRGKSRRDRCPFNKTHILAVLELLALIMDFVGFREASALKAISRLWRVTESGVRVLCPWGAVGNSHAISPAFWGIGKVLRYSDRWSDLESNLYETFALPQHWQKGRWVIAYGRARPVLWSQSQSEDMLMAASLVIGHPQPTATTCHDCFSSRWTSLNLKEAWEGKGQSGIMSRPYSVEGRLRSPTPTSALKREVVKWS